MKTSLKTRLVIRLYSIVLAAAICPGGATSAVAQQGHTLMARYTFDTSDAYADSSGDNNELGGSSWNSTSFILTNNAVEGGQAVYFDSFESLAAYCPSHTYDDWMAIFYGSYSVSLWLNTTNVVGNDNDDLGYDDQAIIFDFNYNNGGSGSSIPIGLTGTKVGFLTVDTNGNYDTLHSTNDVTTGAYIHVVVTRNQSTGEKKIYINGVLDSSEIGTTNYLDGDNNYASIGGTAGEGYVGLLDDVQMYRGVLCASNVAYLYANPGMTVPDVSDPSGLVAFYDFDEGFVQAADLSGSGNNIVNSGNFGGPSLSTNPITGHGAVLFNGGSFLTPSSNLIPTLAANFSLSLWVATTQNAGYGGEPPYQGEGIFAADMPGGTNDITPLGLTGGGLGFNGGSATNNDDWINTTININDGNFHHVVVTRNYVTGAKQIFVDGVFNISDTNNPGLENAPSLVTIGAIADASQSDPTSPTYSGYGGFVGSVSDIQIYSRVLSNSEVAYLYNHPGGNVTNGLICSYDFDEGTVLASDVSGHGNDMVYAGSFYYNGPGPQLSPNSESGPAALVFDSKSYLVPEGNLPSTLAGNFSLSAWLNTTQSLGASGDPANLGAGVITAQVPWESDDLIPLALTGGDVTFQTDGNSTDLLTASSPINNGNYHHVVVTRDQATGTKQIYIDGALNSSDTDDGSVLNSPQILILGALADASNGDPHGPSSDGTNGYSGLLDQLQVYSRVISSDEVAFLYNNPGATLESYTNSSAPPNPFGNALGQPGLTWTTSGNADWFVESTNVYSTNADAAQSGSLRDGQSSILQTTITGPGTISFYWQTTANNDDFRLVFDIDGNQMGSIDGQTAWTQATFAIADSNTHTLTWNANTLGGSGSWPTDAGFLDQVVFSSGVAPVITLNPANQTNYLDYTVGLLAGATSVPAPTWQWYQVGNPTPIAGATSNYFIPANFGTSAVAGSYYAVASNASGSNPTTSAQISFVNAAPPDGWSIAVRSPYQAQFDNKSISDYMAGCAVDSLGEVYVADQYQGDVNVNTSSETENTLTTVGTYGAAALIKYDPNGNVIWGVGLTNNDTNSESFALCVAAGPGNGAYLASIVAGTNWLGTNKYIAAGGGSILLSRFDVNGSNIWSKLIGPTNYVFNEDNTLASDASGNVTLGGLMNGTINFGGSNLTASGQQGFVVQYNSNGVLNWVQSLPGIATGVASSGGQVYVSFPAVISGGATNLVFGTTTNATDRSYGLASLNSATGKVLWLRGVGESYGANTNGVPYDAPIISLAGTNVFVTGTAVGSSVEFGTLSEVLPNGQGQYFARYDTNGNPQAASVFGSPSTLLWAAAANSSGVYVCGDFDYWSAFGDSLLFAPEYFPSFNGPGYFTAPFMAKFDLNGNPIWARNAVSSYQANFRGIAVTTDGVWGSGFVAITNNNASLTYVPAQYGTIQAAGDPHLVVVGSQGMIAFNVGGVLAKITETTAPLPVTLIDSQKSGANFEFSFMSQANTTNYVQYSTDLATTNWLSYTNIVGDGTLKTIVVPANSPAAKFFRISTE